MISADSGICVVGWAGIAGAARMKAGCNVTPVVEDGGLTGLGLDMAAWSPAIWNVTHITPRMKENSRLKISSD